LPYVVWDDAFLYNIWRIFEGNPTNITQLISPEADDSISNPVISPDGTMVAYCQNNGPSFGEATMYVISALGGTPVQLDAVTGSEVLHPYWRPDSGKIVYTIGDAAGHFHGDGIWEINPDGTGKNQLLASAGGGDGFVRPQYNRDGSLIAFMRADFDPTQTSPELWVMNADGTGDALVVAMGVLNQECSQFAFANTSDRIAYETGGTGDVFTIDPDGTDQVEISDGSEQWFVTKYSWAPDDSYLIGGRFRQPARFDLAGGVTDLGVEISTSDIGRRGHYLWEGRIYFLHDSEDSFCSILPDGTDFRKDHVLADTGASDWSGTSGIEYL